MGLRMAGTAIAAALTVAAILVFSAPRAAVGAPTGKTPLLVLTERRGPVLPAASGGVAISDANCDPGEQVAGGGFHWGTYDSALDDFGLNRASGQEQDAEVVRSSPYGARAWRATVLNTSASSTIDMRAFVMCAKIQ